VSREFIKAYRIELARNELSGTGMWSFNRNSLKLILLPFEINNITQPGESELLAIQCLTFVLRQKAVTVRDRSTKKNRHFLVADGID